jgi:hypothetical protein
MAKCIRGRRKKPKLDHDLTSEKTESGQVPIQTRVGHLSPACINDEVYRPVSPDDPSIKKLADSIKKRGILQPLHATLNDVVLSGHRRLCAAKLAGLEEVPVIRVPIYSDDEQFVPLLVEHNKQREKGFDEILREAAIAGADDCAPQVALRIHRQDRSEVYTSGTVIDGGNWKMRANFSEAKTPFLEAVQKVCKDLRDFWPLSVRQIHYQLLNDPPLKHASKPDSRYRNDKKSYKSLVDLCIRARLLGGLSWAAIHDPTRPVTEWRVASSAGQFVQQQTEEFLNHYARDLLQSQPNHIEIVGEKNTIASIVKRVAMEYCIPVTIGRGFCSGPPRKAIVDRWRESGKEKLVLLVLSDHDPDGCEIAESLERSFRGDFCVPPDDLIAIRAALTAEQVDELQLPASAEQAKRSSTNYEKFAAEHGDDVYELESVSPKELQELLRNEIQQVLDWELFEQEQDQEREDVLKLTLTKSAVLHALKSIDLEGGE